MSKAAERPGASAEQGGPGLFQFSTDLIAPAQRLDFWVAAVGSAIAPMVTTSPETRNFNCSFTAAPLDTLLIVQASGSEQYSARTRECLAADVGHSFHLIADFGSAWMLDWRGDKIALRPGDLIFTDSRFLHAGGFPNGCEVLNIKLPPAWAANWLRVPERLAGIRIAHDIGWGRALSSFAAQLSPRMAATAPLPQNLIAQNLGSLLALVEAELFGEPVLHGRVEREMHERVRDAIRQRASEPGLTAAEVARALAISERTLHRALAGTGDTFASLLIRHRMELARRMLMARHFDRLTTAEIGSRAGFADASYFVRAARQHLGATPAKYRGGARP